MRLIFIGEVFLTEVPEEDFRSGVALENTSHEPLAFLSGSFKGSQLSWVTVDKEGFAIVNAFRRLEYLLWGGVHIFTDHRNLTYISNPEACVTSVTKAMAQRLENWKALLGQYRYVIERISRERNSCLLYTSPSPRDLSTSRMPSSA